MWFFMYTCYIMNFLSFVLLILTGQQGYSQFFVGHANHPTFAILTIIIYLFTQTLVMFYFVGIGVSVRDYTLKKHLSPDFHKRSVEIKRRLYPPLMLNILIVSVLFISGGAAHTGRIPMWIHASLYYAALMHFAYSICIQHCSFKKSTDIVLAMSGLKRNVLPS